MTAPTPIDEFVTETGYGDQAMRKARDILAIEVGILRIVGGGQGRAASYELLELRGAGADPPLPLLGRARTSAPRAPSGPALFDTVEATPNRPAADVRANSIVDFHRRWFSAFHRCCLAYFGDFHRRWFSAFHRCSLPLGIDPRARAVEEIRRSEYGEVEGARAHAREVEEFLAWFDAEYAVFHQGARCSITRAPDAGRVTDLLCHGRTLDRLKAMTLKMWRLTTDGVHGSDRWYIAERVPVRNIWLLHRKADFLDAEVSRASLTAAPEMNVWTRVLERIETKVNRHSYHTWFKGSTLSREYADVIIVAVDTELKIAWLRKHYGSLIEEAVAEVLPSASPPRVEFVVDAARRQYG